MTRTVQAAALRGALLLLVALLVGCDHATKLAAKAALEGATPLSIIPGLLDFEYAENRDTAFSLSRGWAHPAKAWLLLGLALLVLAAVLAVWWRRTAPPRHARRGLHLRKARPLEHAAFALIVGGAIGNVVDRAGHGYVVDFIHVHRWPVFNIADIAITLGALLIGWTAVRQRTAQAAER
jgi:signal peptidase II